MIEMPIKTQLIAEIDQEWAYILSACARLNEEQMLAHDAPGEWSVKDTLSHISAWEKFLLDRLGYVLTGQTPQYAIMQTQEDVDRFNARVYEENQERPLASVQIEFRSLFQGVMTVIQALSDEMLSQPYSYDFIDDHLTLLQLIRANIVDHYREHCKIFE
ncbi:MAG TPA: DinB family protein [Anaerolineales bacterium]